MNKLETAYQAKSQMTFQQFCQQVLGQSAATAKQMNDLWLVYASGKVEYDKDSPTGAETPDQRRDSLRRVAAQRSRGQF